MAINDIPIGELLRRWRVWSEWSCSELARAVEVTEGAIRHYEAGRRPISSTMLEAMLEAMDIGRAVFFAALPLAQVRPERR